MNTYIEEMTPSAPGRNQRVQGSGLPTWFAFIAGGVLTFLFVYIGVARPAAEELAKMRRRMSTLEQSVWEVAGHKETALQSNQLLALLAEQKEHLAAARETFQVMQDLHDAMRSEADRLREASQIAHDLITVKDTLLADGDQLDSAANIVSRSAALHMRLSDSRTTLDDAQQASDKLLQLESKLSSHTNNLDEAQNTLDDLFALSDKLNIDVTVIDDAHSRVRDLVDLKDTILSQTGNLADAIETLELTAELGDQFRLAAGSFDQMRKWMVEVVAMEPMLKRVQQTLEPLTELGNLRRLDPEQLRQVARQWTQSAGHQLARSQGHRQVPSPSLGPEPRFDFSNDDLQVTTPLTVESQVEQNGGELQFSGTLLLE